MHNRIKDNMNVMDAVKALTYYYQPGQGGRIEPVSCERSCFVLSQIAMRMERLDPTWNDCQMAVLKMAERLGLFGNSAAVLCDGICGGNLDKTAVLMNHYNSRGFRLDTVINNFRLTGNHGLQVDEMVRERQQSTPGHAVVIPIPPNSVVKRFDVLGPQPIIPLKTLGN